MLVDPPALRAGFLLPAGDGALIEVEGDDNSLHRTAVGKQRHDCEHQPPRLVHPVEGGVFGLGEGRLTAIAAITALFVAMPMLSALARPTAAKINGKTPRLEPRMVPNREMKKTLSRAV